MEFHNPVTQLEWLYGKWEGRIVRDEEETESVLTIKPIGSEIIEFNHTILDNKKYTQFEKNIIFYDKTHEIVKLFTINHEGYIEISDISLNDKSKEIILTSTFSLGYNLPPNMKIKKKWVVQKNPKLMNYEVKMGKNERIVLKAEFHFSKH